MNEEHKTSPAAEPASAAPKRPSRKDRRTAPAAADHLKQDTAVSQPVAASEPETAVSQPANAPEKADNRQPLHELPENFEVPDSPKFHKHRKRADADLTPNVSDPQPPADDSPASANASPMPANDSPAPSDDFKASADGTHPADAHSSKANKKSSGSTDLTGEHADAEIPEINYHIESEEDIIPHAAGTNTNKSDPEQEKGNTRPYSFRRSKKSEHTHPYFFDQAQKKNRKDASDSPDERDDRLTDDPDGPPPSHSDTAAIRMEYREREEKELKRDLKLVVIWAAVILICVGSFSIYCLTRKTMVNLNSYLTITTEGYNSLGTAKAVFDEEAFIEQYKGIIKYRQNPANTKTGEYANAAEAMLRECIHGSLNKTSDLSIDDRITYIWEIDTEKAAKDYHCDLRFENIDFTVTDLPQADLFDPFGNISVSYEGTSPYGKVNIVVRSTDKEFGPLLYTPDKEDHLANGDKITIRITDKNGKDPSDALIRDFGKLPSTLERTYTVNGLVSYLTSMDQLPDDMFQKMQKSAEDYIQSAAARSVSQSKPAVAYLGSYLLTQNELDGSAEDLQLAGNRNVNMIVLVYKVHFENENWNEPITYYSYAAFSNVRWIQDGTLSVDLNNLITPSGDPFLGKNAKQSVEFKRNVLLYKDSFFSRSKTFTFRGFETVDGLYERCINPYLDLYDLKSDMKEGPTTR
ncbi:MAG: hypothetical protein Q4B22_05055 [Eubacteriales bacterium]|nr:hypothetical protein [Eubacteriales bacterium]